MLPFRKLWLSERECEVCGRRSRLTSEAIGVCVECLRSDLGAAEVALERHRRERVELGLPPNPPRDPSGVPCGLCDLNCRVLEGSLGYCGLIKSEGGRLIHLSGQPKYGVLRWYYDPHPTNCVAFWFCPGATGCGYPKFAVKPGCERGYANLAVFYGACNHNCAFCQNWFYRRDATTRSPRVSVEELLGAALHSRVTCVCFFGGDPAPQVLHALAFTRELLLRAEGRVMRVCWESNGHFSPRIMSKVIEVSLKSGGNVKFDMKAWNSNIYRALTGVEVGSLLENAKRVAEAAGERREVPLFTASTLLVPGYVDEEEVRGIARFLASLSPEIPYSLLAFHPNHRMIDLPPTSRRHAEGAVRAAREEGLLNVRVGNPWLLGNYY